MAFNKALLESVVKTQFSVNKILGIECLSPHVKDDPVGNGRVWFRISRKMFRK
jgi:hypothetical protein